MLKRQSGLLRPPPIPRMLRVMKAENAEPLEINGIRLGPALTEEQAKAIFADGTWRGVKPRIAGHRGSTIVLSLRHKGEELANQ